MFINGVEGGRWKVEGAEGFTLIELVATMLIASILAVSGAYLMTHLVRAAVYVPNSLSSDMAGEDFLNGVIEGDAAAGGLRFSRAVTTALSNEIAFLDQDGTQVRYRLDTAQGIVNRAIGSSTANPFPYYTASGMHITGTDNKIFTYYDSLGTITTDPASVRRVVVGVVARTGNGAFSDWQASTELVSSAAVHRFE